MANNPPAGWHQDPMRRFQHRYWDGSRWTEHVSTGGTRSIDVLSPTPAPAAHDPLEQNPPATVASASGKTTRCSTSEPSAA